MSKYHGPNLLSNYSVLLEENTDELVSWFERERAKQPMPLYASVDIRDAGWKVAAVDANAYPAGFNNVGESERESLSEQLQEWLVSEHPQASWLHIWPEKHTRNKGYIENLIVLQDILSKCNCKVTVGSNEFEGILEIEGITGTLQLSETTTDGILRVDGETPDVLILNNDLTGGILPGLLSDSVSPSAQMGWHRRRKSEHFIALQGYCQEVAELLEIDDWHLLPMWFVSEDKCLEKESCLTELAAEINNFIAIIKSAFKCTYYIPIILKIVPLRTILFFILEIGTDMNAFFIKKINQYFFIHIVIGCPIIAKIAETGTNTFIRIK